MKFGSFSVNSTHTYIATIHRFGDRQFFGPGLRRLPIPDENPEHIIASDHLDYSETA